MVHQLPHSLLRLAPDELWRIIFAKSRTLDMTKRRAAAFEDKFVHNRARWSCKAITMGGNDVLSYDYTIRLGENEDDVVEFPPGSEMWFTKELIFCLHTEEDLEPTSSTRLWSADDMVSPEAFDEIEEVAFAFEEDEGTTVYMEACEVSLESAFFEPPTSCVIS